MRCEVGGSRALTRLSTNTIYVKPNLSEPLNCVPAATTKLCAEKGSAANPVFFDQVPGLLGLFPETDLSILIRLGAGEYGSPDRTYMWDRPVQIRGQGMNATRLLGSHVFQPAVPLATGRDSSSGGSTSQIDALNVQTTGDNDNSIFFQSPTGASSTKIANPRPFTLNVRSCKVGSVNGRAIRVGADGGGTVSLRITDSVLSAGIYVLERRIGGNAVYSEEITGTRIFTGSGKLSRFETSNNAVVNAVSQNNVYATDDASDGAFLYDFSDDTETTMTQQNDTHTIGVLGDRDRTICTTRLSKRARFFWRDNGVQTTVQRLGAGSILWRMHTSSHDGNYQQLSTNQFFNGIGGGGIQMFVMRLTDMSRNHTTLDGLHADVPGSLFSIRTEHSSVSVVSLQNAELTSRSSARPAIDLFSDDAKNLFRLGSVRHSHGPASDRERDDVLSAPSPVLRAQGPGVEAVIDSGTIESLDTVPILELATTASARITNGSLAGNSKNGIICLDGDNNRLDLLSVRLTNQSEQGAVIYGEPEPSGRDISVDNIFASISQFESGSGPSIRHAGRATISLSHLKSIQMGTGDQQPAIDAPHATLYSAASHSLDNTAVVVAALVEQKTQFQIQ